MPKGFNAHLVLHLVLIMTTLAVVVPRVRTEQAPSSVRPQAAADIASRVARVVNGLRPRVEVVGAPMRWSLAVRMAEYKAPAVSIAIVEGGRVVWAQGFGVKEAGGTSPVTATTLFQAGSNSKAVAVSAMLRLAQAGRLSLDANVNQYLTSWKLPENEFTAQAPVTLRRLATHTGGTTVSGFPGYQVGVPRPTVPELLDGKAPANTPAVRVDTVPGKGFRYSGGGTTINWSASFRTPDNVLAEWEKLGFSGCSLRATKSDGVLHPCLSGSPGQRS
jgi:CubicO group peptidase (beta-lactamase class C family)